MLQITNRAYASSSQMMVLIFVYYTNEIQCVFEELNGYVAEESHTSSNSVA